MRNFLLLSAMVIGFTNLTIAQSNEFDIETLWKLKRISGTKVSPNEKWILFQATSYEMEKNKGTTVNYLMDLATKEKKEILNSSAYNIDWTPTNHLVFLENEGSNTHLSKYDPVAGTKTILHNFGDTGIDGFVMTADGNRFATLEAVKIKEDVYDKYPDLPLAKARVEDNLMYRHWNAWSGNEAPHLFWYEKNGTTFTKKRDVMFGENFSSVTGPFGGIESVCWSLDGTVLYYSTKKKSGKEFAVSTNSEIYAFRTVDNITTTLTSAHKGYDTEPKINYNGKTLAWLSMDEDGNEASKNKLRIMDLASRVEKELTLNWDLSVESATWHPSKDIIFISAAVKGRKMVFQVDVASGKITQITNEICDFVNVVALKDRLILERQSMIDPTDIWVYTMKTKSMENITSINADILKNYPVPSVQEKWYTTTDGKKLLTWVIMPPNFDAAKKYPALLYCQGGPQSPVSQYFSYRWNFRVMASHGYIVVAPNRRGLPGFGEEWNAQISKDWGGQAMNDYLVAIDSSVAQIPAIDKERLGAVGASYGGYSVYYLAGIHNNRFKTFVSHCGLFNLESWYGTTEEMFFANHDIGGPYWLPENKELYAKNSPHKMVDKWNTPMMVIHGGKDFRVPESEGMQAFQVLQIKNIPSKYLYFPDEGHWITKPQNGVLWYREYFDWLDSFLMKAQ